jgi:hypothetical protein
MEVAVAFQLDGQYFENCSCEVVCPCTASLALGADYDRCQVILVFHVDSGDVDGTDVSGLTVAAVADTPKVMSDGGWRLGVVIDDAASEQQAEALGAVFSGAAGGPMVALAGLVGEQLGVERLPIEFSSDNGSHHVKIGDSANVTVEDVVPFGVEGNEPAKVTDIFHPANSTLNIAKAGASTIDLFGLQISNEGKAAFSGTFSWAA